jgi:HlyD family secretion protein
MIMQSPPLTATRFGLVLAAVVGTGLVVSQVPPNQLGSLQVPSLVQAHAADAAPRPAWEASATGRVEPKDGLVAISTQVPGRIADVAVKINDRVLAGDLLVRLDDEDLLIRSAAALSEAQVRERERDEEVVKGLALERRQAEDGVAKEERALYRARLAFDDLAAKARSGRATNDEAEKARGAIAAVKDQLALRRDALGKVLAKDAMPLSTRVEASLAAARAELALAEAAVERTRIRAPSDGSVLTVLARTGELATPSAEAPVVMFGDLKGLRVKAEVEDRDATKVRVGQRVVIKGDAYPDREFEGRVTSVSQALSSPRIATRGVRRPNDVEVIEAVIALEGTPPLYSGMRVDVFFKYDGAPPAAAAAVVPTGSAPKTN